MAIVVSSNSITYASNSSTRENAINNYSPYITYSNLVTISGKTEFTDNSVSVASLGTITNNIMYSCVALFTSSGTFNVPASTTNIRLIVVGGGQGGAAPGFFPRPQDQGGPYPVGSPPGNPAYVAIKDIEVPPSSTLPIVVGRRDAWPNG